MPPIRRFAKEDIINTAVEILKDEGIENVNARKIAKKLNCSVQPIFHNFTNMDELKNELIKKIYLIYTEYMKQGESCKQAYKGIGLSYIKFARDYPNFFKAIFMSQSNLTPDKAIDDDDKYIGVIENGMKFSGLSYEEQKKFHLKAWIFTHRYGYYVNNKYCSFF